MALLFMDTMQHCDMSSTDLITRKWTDITTNVPSIGYGPQYGRNGMNGLWLSGTAGRGMYKGITVGGSDVFFGGWILFTSTPGAAAYFAVGEGATEHVSLRGDASGHLTVTRAGAVLGTSTATVSSGVWYWIELRVKVHDTTGTYELRVNGTATGWVSGSGDTRNGGTGTPTSLLILNGSGAQYCGAFIADNSGPNANTWAGPSTFHCRVSSAPGYYTQWTPNSGPNHSNVGESKEPDDDQTFNQSSTAGQKDTFKGNEVPAVSGSIYAIQHVLRAKQDGGAARTVRPIVRISGTDYNGTDFNTPGSYAYQLEPVSTSPASSSAWTISEVNGAEFGYELVS